MPIANPEDVASGASSAVGSRTASAVGLSSLSESTVPTDVSQEEALPIVEYTVGRPPESALEKLARESRRCIEHLAGLPVPETRDYGLARLAAVLVTLYQREGEDSLRVLLTTRAAHLRRNPGQTALPGGKQDPEDPSAVYTARREAYEEVALPLDHPDIYTVAVLEPLLTVLPLNAHMRNHIVVTPVVVFVADPRIIDQLHPNPDEVDCIFDHPLKAIHAGKVDGPAVDDLVPKGDWWPLDDEFHSLEDRVGSTGAYRMHRFRTRHTPIRGFTSDVLIRTATLAYAAEPEYGHFAPEQAPFHEVIADVVERLPAALQESPTVVAKRPLEWGKSGGFVASGETYYSQ